MSIRSFFRGLFGSSEKAVEVSTPVVVVEEEKVATKEIDVEKAKAAIEQRLKEISEEKAEEKKSEEKKSEEKKVTAKEIKAKVKKTPETKVEQPAKAKTTPAKTEKKTENKPRASRKKTDK
jgi:hypothetical protein